jgi:hypothetical protein
MTALSVNAQRMGGGGNHGGERVTDWESCVRACSSFRNGKGCNTITFCNNAAGCGSGCNNGDLGPFGGPSDKCTADGRYPYGMCSLKWNPDINNPEIYEEPSGEWLAMTTAGGFPRQG